MARKKSIPSVGDVIQIYLGDDLFFFARTLKSPLYAFYDQPYNSMPDLREICSNPIAFKIWVRASALRSDRWSVVGNLDLTPDLEEAPAFFKQDPINKKLYIYKDGKDIPASRSECLGLERAAVWDPEQVEERLRSRVLGIESRNLAVMRLPDA